MSDHPDDNGDEHTAEFDSNERTADDPPETVVHPDTGEELDPGEHDWPVIESETEYETGWYDGGYDLVEQPDGTEKRYYWAELPPAVVIVARAGDDLVMVEQHRPTIGEFCLELPAGIVEDGESFTTAGARELREETGFDPAGISLVEDFWVATGVLRHRRGIVFAEGLEPVSVDRDSNEFLRIRRVPIDEALDEVRADPANDASIEGILLARADGLLP
jgi:ADP-ribose pyrophosphatase